jgi:hypothetical protein
MMVFFVPPVMPHRHVPVFTGWPQPPVQHKVHPPGVTVGSPVPGAHMEPLHLGTLAPPSAHAQAWLVGSASAQASFWPRYDKLTAGLAIALVPWFNAADVPVVLQHERNHKNRKKVVAALQRRVAVGH